MNKSYYFLKMRGSWIGIIVALIIGGLFFFTMVYPPEMRELYNCPIVNEITQECAVALSISPYIIGQAIFILLASLILGFLIGGSINFLWRMFFLEDKGETQ